MKNFRNSKKFIAFVDGNGYVRGKSGFYIVDVDSWNANQMLPKNANYSPDIYEEIEKLGENCKMIEENHFLVNEAIETPMCLHEFLLPLTWIDAIDEYEDTYYDPDSLDNFQPKNPYTESGDSDEGEMGL